jgi:glutamate 5-kinase
MNVILVSSGAVGVGCQRMGLEERPTLLAQKQALAAVGQLHLMRCYDDLFSTLGMVRQAAQHIPQWAGGLWVHLSSCWGALL